MTDVDQSTSSSDVRKGKARERQRRRRKRQGTTHVLNTPVRRRISKQLAPLGERRLDLSQFNTPLVRLVALSLGALVFMGTIIVIVGLFKNDPVSLDPNGLWVGDQWTYQVQTDEQIRELVNRLRQHQIGVVFARVSELNIDLTWTGRLDGVNRFPEVEGHVKRFVEQMKREYPNLVLYGVVSVRSDLGESGNRLNEQITQQAVVDFSQRVVDELGFDGVMLDVRPVLDADEGYLGLVRQVRRRIGDNALVAVAVPPDWTPEDENVPVPSVIATGTVWSNTYKQRVALLQVDLIVVQAYNSYLTTADDYIDWMAYQVRVYAGVVGSLDTHTDVLIGIPTYTDEYPAHDTQVENVDTAIEGVRRGLLAAPETAGVVDGIAIFAEWDTDEAEWSQIKVLWVQ